MRARLALSYLGFVVVTGAVLFAATAAVLRFVPHGNLVTAEGGSFVPDRADLVRAFLPRALAAMAVVCILGAAAGWLIAGRAVRRLEGITETAALVGAGSLRHRVELSGPHDEIRRLAETFDDMVGRVERHVETERQFAANAAHQLRTPHAVTRSLLEVAQADPTDVDVRTLLARLTEVNDRAVALTEALLTFARADTVVPDQQPVDLTLLVDDALDTVAVISDRLVEVHSDLRDAVVCGEPTLLSQLVGNLVHNAFRHNLPEGGWVHLSTGRQAAGTVMLRVENPGAELTSAIVATLTEPFRRGLAGRDIGGAGLGLAVAAAIARAHDVRLSLTPRRGGGLIAEVSFPPVAANTRRPITSVGSDGIHER